jgi:hypothetical protein
VSFCRPTQRVDDVLRKGNEHATSTEQGPKFSAVCRVVSKKTCLKVFL